MEARSVSRFVRVSPRKARLVADLELDHLLITRSDRGMMLVGRDGPPLTLPAEAREVFDVTGAGDTFMAAHIAAEAAGIVVIETKHD